MRISQPLLAELQEQVRSLSLDYVESPEFESAESLQYEADWLGKGPETNSGKDSSKQPADKDLHPIEPPLSLGCQPLLSREQERHLFRKMNYLKFKAKRLRDLLGPFPTDEEQLKQILFLAHEAAAVQNKIVAANLRLVISIVKKQITGGIPFRDLVSDGNWSLIKAAEKFDYRRGIRFSTYASNAIWRNFSRTIPGEQKYRTRFRPMETEVFETRIDDRRTLYQHERAEQERQEQLTSFLNELDDRERRIVSMRFGLDTGPRTLRQVGNEIGVTKERVRQIEIHALKKMRLLAEEKKWELPELR